jgi:DNA-binding SARP family transcriptional activator
MVTPDVRQGWAVYDRRVVSTLVIRLLGPPGIERDGGVVAPPRGHKAWAVLAYVVLAERPVPRTRLEQLLFADAADPRGALRWTLAEVAAGGWDRRGAAG